MNKKIFILITALFGCAAKSYAETPVAESDVDRILGPSLSQLPKESKIRAFCSNPATRNGFHCKKLGQVLFCALQASRGEMSPGTISYCENVCFRGIESDLRYYANKILQEEDHLKPEEACAELDLILKFFIKLEVAATEISRQRAGEEAAAKAAANPSLFTRFLRYFKEQEKGASSSATSTSGEGVPPSGDNRPS